MDRAQLADFLRRRREPLQPDDVGIGAGSRRRTKGLRREGGGDARAHVHGLLRATRAAARSAAVSSRCSRRSPGRCGSARTSATTLFRLAGHTPGPRARRTDHVNPALMRVLDRIDAPAQVMSDLGETLVQNPLAVALVGDRRRASPARSAACCTAGSPTRPSDRSIRRRSTSSTHASMWPTRAGSSPVTPPTSRPPRSSSS